MGIVESYDISMAEVVENVRTPYIKMRNSETWNKVMKSTFDWDHNVFALIPEANQAEANKILNKTI